MGKRNRYPQPGSLLRYTGGSLEFAYVIHNALKHGETNLDRFGLQDPLRYGGLRKRIVY